MSDPEQAGSDRFGDAIEVLEREVRDRAHPQDDYLRFARRVLLSERGDADAPPVRADGAGEAQETGSDHTISRFDWWLDTLFMILIPVIVPAMVVYVAIRHWIPDGLRRSASRIRRVVGR